MEKTVKVIGLLKWLALPLGYIMYFFTGDSSGEIPSLLLGFAAALAFWLLIKSAISEAANVESFIEIKRLRSGIIARVYLINARDKVELVHRSISRRIEACSLKKYLLIMQMTDIPGLNALRESQRLLNEQLIEEILKKRRGE